VETTVVRLALDGLDDAELAGELGRAVADHAARRTVDLLRLWRFHHSQGEAVTGAAPVAQALAEGRAALLLIHDDRADERHGWFGPDAAQLALDMAQAAPIAGDERLLEGRLNDVVIRTALLTGCPVYVVPSVEETLDDGMGVILAERATPSSIAQLLEL
jgi:hypothetical protein